MSDNTLIELAREIEEARQRIIIFADLLQCGVARGVDTEEGEGLLNVMRAILAAMRSDRAALEKRNRNPT
jgi:hypothetical protein